VTGISWQPGPDVVVGTAVGLLFGLLVGADRLQIPSTTQNPIAHTHFPHEHCAFVEASHVHGREQLTPVSVVQAERLWESARRVDQLRGSSAQ
jgi:hypothetical protein